MTKANLALAAAAMVFGVGCLVLFRDLSTDRDRVQALEAQIAQLQRDMRRAEPATPEPPAQTAVIQPAATPSNVTASTPAANKPAAANANPGLELQRRINADPAYRTARLAERRAELQPEYPQLAAELGLSRQEAERFLDLLAEQGLRENESVMKKQPGDSQERRRKLFEQQEQERREFLGEERFQRWTEYVNSADARAMVGQLRTQLATTSSPLRDDQVKPLVKALATEQQRHWAERQQNYGNEAQWTEETPLADRIAYMERRARLIEESNVRSREAGAMYLDSTQQRSFDAMLERQKERARVELESWRAFLEAEERQKSRPGSQ